MTLCTPSSINAYARQVALVCLVAALLFTAVLPNGARADGQVCPDAFNAPVSPWCWAVAVPAVAPTLVG
ncbi:hypothetical protein [Halioxenophilus sp. WMMB6]|uniref:hypothetical protein n=1 Tax=Halioxenophilus sp. WMMB6 TaxID=3073815 RepID=UPI00295E61D7|nr:hypothetical protein [Halioxenophilus sp. WMMB6]